MSLLVREWEIKMELIASISKSQQALAKILDCVADHAECSPEAARSLRENIRILTNLQQTMTEKVVGMNWNRPKVSGPGKVWIADERFAVCAADDLFKTASSEQAAQIGSDRLRSRIEAGCPPA